MNRDIHRFIKECPRCQEHGHKTVNERAYPILVPVKPFAQVGIDIKHVVPSQTGHRYIIVAIDYLTKYIEVSALRQQTATEISEFIYRKIISVHSTPTVFITDNGRPFVSEIVEKVCRTFGIKHKTISPYHSQTNGLVERVNRTIDSIMKKRSIDEKQNWTHYLDATAYAYRTIKQATTNQSPFYLLYGYEPNTAFDNAMRPLDVEEPSFEIQLKVRAFMQIKYLQDVRKEAWKRIEQSQKVQRKRIDAKIENTKKEYKPGFKVGDIVKLYRDNISTSWSAKIMIRWYEDNFCIQEKLQKGNYYIKNITNPEDTRLRLVHGNRLKSWIQPHVNWAQEANLVSISNL